MNGASTIGKTLRIFSTYSQLIELKNHPSLKKIVSSKEVDFSPIAEVPPHAVPVRFIRDRSVDHYFLNCRKHEEFREKAGTLRRLPCISFTSSGFSSPHNKGHCFSVFVRREEADQHITGPYTNYGLSRSGSTVPWFE
ncbi:type I-F CRISPR-associated endoribonuclease Cas6/Csy4 [Endozoicomonas sp.]|uniref:type I-F CRISPR-associated endoribonuclease Cas6/Csy4 n=1 Tax=Endozoicomonas sp. TaxID=1892382 RepID=UPI003AF9DFDF